MGIAIFAIIGILSLSLVTLVMPELRAPMRQQSAQTGRADGDRSEDQQQDVATGSRAERSSEPV